MAIYIPRIGINVGLQMWRWLAAVFNFLIDDGGDFLTDDNGDRLLDG
jgi:hypothetical protein